MRDVTDISSPSVLLSKVLTTVYVFHVPICYSNTCTCRFFFNVHVVECACMMMSQVAVHLWVCLKSVCNVTQDDCALKKPIFKIRVCFH